MSLFRGTIRPPAIASDEAVERYLAAIRAELAPDPLFRRRLRGEVMNRYVAGREGIGAAPQRRSMGRLGRAVLYASFTLALSTTSVLAVSQEALPGDLLYPLKRQVERLRMEVLPAELHHDLAAYELAERIDELARLSERGDTTRIASTAAVVVEDYEAFLAEADAAGLPSDDRYLTVLTALLDRLPETAQDAVQAVIDRAPAHGAGGSRGPAGSGNGGNGEPPGRTGAGVPSGPSGPSGNGDGSTSEPDDVEPTPKATKSPKPEPEPRASRQPEPSQSVAVPGSGDESDEANDEDQDGQ